jgi:DnaJ domain
VSATIPVFDLYAELGVDESASAEAVDAAYRALIKRHHPDLAGEAGVERSKRLNAAHAWLRDPIRRDAYDQSRRTSIHADQPSGPSRPDTVWTTQRPWWPGPGGPEQADSQAAGGSYQPRDHPYAERPRRPARQAPPRRSPSRRGHPRAESDRPARDPAVAQEGRVLAGRLIKLAAAALAIAVVVGALQNGGAIVGGRQPQGPPVAVAASENAMTSAGSATVSPTVAATPTAVVTLKPDVVLQGSHPYWTSTGIHVKAGERLLITASGQILWDPGVREPTVGPEGASWTPENVASPAEFLFQQSPIASLIGEVAGTMFWVGASAEITAPASGELRLALNERWVDGAWDDNRGSWAVVVERERTESS